MIYLIPRYDAALVLASILIATLLVYVMLDLAERMRSGSRPCARPVDRISSACWRIRYPLHSATPPTPKIRFKTLTFAPVCQQATQS